MPARTCSCTAVGSVIGKGHPEHKLTSHIPGGIRDDSSDTRFSRPPIPNSQLPTPNPQLQNPNPSLATCATRVVSPRHDVLWGAPFCWRRLPPVGGRAGRVCDSFGGQSTEGGQDELPRSGPLGAFGTIHRRPLASANPVPKLSRTRAGGRSTVFCGLRAFRRVGFIGVKLSWGPVWSTKREGKVGVCRASWRLESGIRPMSIHVEEMC
jgi:hypothetical protein